jgi:hypothetical protein
MIYRYHLLEPFRLSLSLRTVDSTRIGSSLQVGLCPTLNWLGFTSLPHIIDADKLRPFNRARQAAWTTPSVWQNRASLLGHYLAKQLNCSPQDVPQKVNLLMRHARYDGMQSHNSRGIAFAGLIKHVLEKFGSPAFSYAVEIEASAIFPGITISGRSTTPRIDLLVRHNDIPVAVISSKWSLRHDRVNDITNECPAYKAAYARIYRQENRKELLYFLVTNEYDSSRLKKVIGDPCIDGLIHIHKTAVVDVCGLGKNLSGLQDLTDLVKATASW